MSYCEACGRALRAGGAFCPSCGAHVESLVAAPTQPRSGLPMSPAPAAAAVITPARMDPLITASSATGGMTTGVWFVLVGAALSIAMTFFFWGVVSTGYDGAATSWTWTFSHGAYSWTGLWPPTFLDGVGDWWTWRDWVVHILWGASMTTTALCAIAGLLALLRGTGAARISGGLIRAFGIANAAALVAYMVYWAINPEYRYVGVTDLAALAGAILIIIGGGMLGPAPVPQADWR
jgi:hypothetical protein